jgi:DNA-directed RNA polymerase subunit K/omega
MAAKKKSELAPIVEEPIVQESMEVIEVPETVAAVLEAAVEAAPEALEAAVETAPEVATEPVVKEHRRRAKPEPEVLEIQEDEELIEHREPRVRNFTGSRLSWLVTDFQGITNSVYEAVMVAANRARQVGRNQKREIDNWNSSQVLTPESIEQEETAEKGIDHFNHIKPTVQALSELKHQDIEFYYLNEEKK